MTDSLSKQVLLGVTGGIAAYKAAEVVRLLVKAGIEVQVVMTEAATHFVTPVTFQALSGGPVFTDQWDGRVASNMPHIELVRAADAVLVAPASADFLARLAHGFATDLLSTLCLARDCPLLVAPAMNRQMWEHPATQRNIAQLRADNVIVLGPDHGDQACGEIGDGRMLEAETLYQEVARFFSPKLLARKRVVLTAGPTFEAIDPVRGLTNSSSGKMGYALARVAQEAGAEVTLVSGPTALQPPAGIRCIRVVSAAEMLAAVEQVIAGSDVFIGVAAVADYTPAQPLKEKMKKSGASLSIELKPTTDILAHVASLPTPPFCVGFAAESEKLLEHAEAKRTKKNLPLIIANLAREAIGHDDTEVVLIDAAGQHPLPRGPKLAVARSIIGHIAAMLGERPAEVTPLRKNQG